MLEGETDLVLLVEGVMVAELVCDKLLLAVEDLELDFDVDSLSVLVFVVEEE